MHDVCLDRADCPADRGTPRLAMSTSTEAGSQGAMDWRRVLRLIVAPAVRLHRYRQRTLQLVEKLIDRHDCGGSR
ncbi:MAG: hypothetical protein QNJ05_00180 [Woeseiaceae bacterium]|nr:hypothetical protein [Woeseiaceae bacterium]